MSKFTLNGTVIEFVTVLWVGALLNYFEIFKPFPSIKDQGKTKCKD
jgi:hypothetical protein